MSTRANIVRKNIDGSYDLIYTHNDGYPEHHAPILLEHYSTDAGIQSLLDLGDLSELEVSIGSKHDFHDRPPEVCTAYGRDRGETGVDSKHLKDHEALKAYLEGSWTEWVYVWDVANQEWLYANNPSPTWFKCCGT
jgi:hypothetical protein